MAANYPNNEPNDLYTRDFLIRVPNAFPNDSRPNKEKQHSILLSLVLSCLSMAAMVVYQQKVLRIFDWDFKIWGLVLITGIVSFALENIFESLFVDEK
jgi:hypothetical protein